MSSQVKLGLVVCRPREDGQRINSDENKMRDELMRIISSLTSIVQFPTMSTNNFLIVLIEGEE